MHEAISRRGALRGTVAAGAMASACRTTRSARLPRKPNLLRLS